MRLKRKFYNPRSNQYSKSSFSKNHYIQKLVKVYKYISRKTRSKFANAVFKRLSMSRKNIPCISLSSVIAKVPNNSEKIIVVIGKILNDERLLKIPKLTICALKISSSAYKRLNEAGVNIITMDQLLIMSPIGKNTILIRGKKSAKIVKKSSTA